MKYALVLSILICMGNALFAQYTYTIKADSVKITNCDSSELIIENHTQAVPGFLYNTGRGRTVFKHGVVKVNGGLYVIGADTLNLNANAWMQGGNSFGATGKLGTLDKNNLNIYINSSQKAILDTNGNFFLTLGSILVGYPAYNGYKLDVYGPTRSWGTSVTSVGDAYDIRCWPSYPNWYDSGVDASIIFFGSMNGLGVNKAAVGNIPASSLILGGASPGKITTICDYAHNPTFAVDGNGTVTINGGYNGISGGGATGNGINANAINFSINGGRGTGTGTTGDIIFSTGTAQTSGSTIHAMTNRWWLKGGTGYLSNSSTPTSEVDVTGAAGYSQFRLRTTYTPTSSTDTNGNVGDFSWDTNYLYVKTSSGWKRSALSTF